MRPQILFPLFRDITDLSGIGPRLAKLIVRAAGPLVVDLLWHLPTGFVDRRRQPSVAEAPVGEIATFKVIVDGHEPPGRPRAPWRVRVRDETGFMTIVFFRPRKDWIVSILPEGETRMISGKVEEYGGARQMTHPDFVLTAEEFAETPLIAPTHPLTAGLTARVMAKAVAQAVERAPVLPDWLDPAHKAKMKWPDWRDALMKAHTPETAEDLSWESAPRQRLAYDELLANQLALALMRERMKEQKGRPIRGTGALSEKVLAALPFSPTGAQTRSFAEIREDMAAPTRMMRLLQGDVGAGKTLVAVLAMVTAVEAGCQAALMAPTEILARQHFASIEPLARSAGLNTILLTGKDKPSVRRAAVEAIASGEVHIVIGTHALFQEDVRFHDLGLAIVDEQHRFGVHQRMGLSGKGAAADVLVMTATPIPRTLSLTAYGDMSVSRLDEKPAGRKPIATRAVPLSRLEEVVAHLAKSLEEGAQAYWVCPLVEESDTLDVTAAEDRHRALCEMLGTENGAPVAGLVHGRMKTGDKDAVMQDFRSGRLKVLVATTVIEVGVDVPNASIIIIEHAERFGLAQLHQLRGRVGRGERASSCLLLYDANAGETARKRLKIMRETEDGFLIAEEDLRLRGAGDVLGTRQSGLPRFRVADLETHAELLQTARDDAGLILARDPGLQTDRGAALRTLLYLFQRDEAVRYLRSG